MNIQHILFIHSSFDGYWDCFNFMAIMNNSAVSICVQVFVWTLLSFLLGLYLV